MNDTMQKTLEVEVLNIQKGEYLSEALKRQGYPMLPSNAIINKVMTRTGATYMELDTKLSPRNSIVIEPFKSSVENKVLIFNEAQGVFKEITVKQLTTYLKNSNIQYKKIITTPEGFLNKVLKVARCLKINVYKEFFCLFDEAEAIVAIAEPHIGDEAAEIGGDEAVVGRFAFIDGKFEPKDGQRILMLCDKKFAQIAAHAGARGVKVKTFQQGGKLLVFLV